VNSTVAPLILFHELTTCKAANEDATVILVCIEGSDANSLINILRLKRNWSRAAVEGWVDQNHN
jgi:hypothetical protein